MRLKDCGCPITRSSFTDMMGHLSKIKENSVGQRVTINNSIYLVLKNEVIKNSINNPDMNGSGKRERSRIGSASNNPIKYYKNMHSKQVSASNDYNYDNNHTYQRGS